MSGGKWLTGKQVMSVVVYIALGIVILSVSDWLKDRSAVTRYHLGYLALSSLVLGIALGQTIRHLELWAGSAFAGLSAVLIGYFIWRQFNRPTDDTLGLIADLRHNLDVAAALVILVHGIWGYAVSYLLPLMFSPVSKEDGPNRT